VQLIVQQILNQFVKKYANIEIDLHKKTRVIMN